MQVYDRLFCFYVNWNLPPLSTLSVFFLHLLVKPQFDRQEEETDVVPLPTAMFGGRLCYRSYFVKSIVLLLWVCLYCKYTCAFRSFSNVCHKYNTNVLYLFFVLFINSDTCLVSTSEVLQLLRSDMSSLEEACSVFFLWVSKPGVTKCSGDPKAIISCALVNLRTGRIHIKVLSIYNLMNSEPLTSCISKLAAWFASLLLQIASV